VAITFAAPAPTGAGLSAFLDAYLKGRGVKREEESDELRRTLAAMQLLQAGQAYQAGERTTAEQALVPEAIQRALAVPERTTALPATGIPGTEAVPQVSEYPGYAAPAEMPGRTVPLGRTPADVLSALQPEQMVALLKHAPGVLPAMGLQSEEQIRQRERREQGRQKMRTLYAQIQDLGKSRRWIDELDKEIEGMGVLLEMADTPEQMAGVQGERRKLLVTRKTLEDDEIERTLGPQEKTRIWEAVETARVAKLKGTDVAPAMSALHQAIGTATTKFGRAEGEKITDRMSKKLLDDLVEDPTEREFHRAVWTDVRGRLTANEPWSPALWAKSARAVIAADPQRYGAMGFTLLQHKTVPDWFKEAFFAGAGTVPGLTDKGLPPEIHVGKIQEEDEARRQGRLPTLQGTIQKAQAWVQGKATRDPVALAQLRQITQGQVDQAQRDVRDAERHLVEAQKEGFRMRDFLPGLEAKVTAANEVVKARVADLKAVEQMVVASLPPGLREVYEKGKPAPAPPPPDMNQVRARQKALTEEEHAKEGATPEKIKAAVKARLQQEFPTLPSIYFPR